MSGKCLVTGGAGFIGSHLSDRLLNLGYQVRILDNFSTGKKENLVHLKNDVEILEGDIRNIEDCRKACEKVNFVFHEAALGSVPRSIENPITSNQVNVDGTLNMLVSARDAGVSRFVFASSSSVYGDTHVLPKVETMANNPMSPYALTKYTGEKYVELFYKLYGFETIALRYFNVFGERQDPNSQYAAVIPRFFTQLLNEKSPVIFGDGHQTRDFTYVDDVIDANILAIKVAKDACGRSYNIACHRQTSILQLFEKIRTLISVKYPKVKYINPEFKPQRLGDVKDSLAGVDLAQKYLGYQAHYSIDEGIEKTSLFYIAQKI